MNNIWIFGCSFSSGYLEVSKENTYGKLLSDELGLNMKNFSGPGYSNDKIFYDLNRNLKNIETNDIVVFQFSSFNRIGFFHDEFNFFTTAGIPELGVKHKIKEPIFNQYSEYELNTLLDYILVWQDKRKRFDFENPINLLDYLTNEKNIKYFLLYMNDDCETITPHTVLLPIDNNINNTSMNNFFIKNKLTLSDDFPYNHKDFFDSHPGISGHKKIKEIILKKINDG